LNQLKASTNKGYTMGDNPHSNMKNWSRNAWKRYELLTNID
jgi:hypothetical protein